LAARITGTCRLNTFSSANEISPTVAFARAASTEAASRLPWPARHFRELRQHGHRLRLVALGAEALQLLDLALAHGGIVDLQDVDLGVTGPPGTC
jgi:hypothetical protein